MTFDSDKREQCPCDYPEIGPCGKWCPCVTPTSSRSCFRCNRLGNREQRLARAKWFAAALDDARARAKQTGTAMKIEVIHQSQEGRKP
jgi:hypothetical protein